MTVFEKHQLKIAKDTMKMSDVGALIMGGMTKDEARVVINRLTKKRRDYVHKHTKPNTP